MDAQVVRELSHLVEQIHDAVPSRGNTAIPLERQEDAIAKLIHALTFFYSTNNEFSMLHRIREEVGHALSPAYRTSLRFYSEDNKSPQPYKEHSQKGMPENDPFGNIYTLLCTYLREHEKWVAQRQENPDSRYDFFSDTSKGKKMRWNLTNELLTLADRVAPEIKWYYTPGDSIDTIEQIRRIDAEIGREFDLIVDNIAGHCAHLGLHYPQDIFTLVRVAEEETARKIGALPAVTFTFRSFVGANAGMYTIEHHFSDPFFLPVNQRKHYADVYTIVLQ